MPCQRGGQKSQLKAVFRRIPLKSSESSSGSNPGPTLLTNSRENQETAPIMATSRYRSFADRSPLHIAAAHLFGMWLFPHVAWLSLSSLLLAEKHHSKQRLNYE